MSRYFTHKINIFFSYDSEYRTIIIFPTINGLILLTLIVCFRRGIDMEWLRKAMKDLSITCNLAEIWTGYTTNTNVKHYYYIGMAVTQLRRLAAGFQPRWPGFDLRSCHAGFVVDKVALGQVFSEYFGFPCKFSFHRLLHTHHHLSSGADAVGQIAADVPSGLSLTSPQEIKKEQYSRL
jgi:hypothetical protein